MSGRLEPVARSRIADFVLVGLLVLASLLAVEWLQGATPTLSEFCLSVALAVTAALFGGLALRWRDARDKQGAGETVAQARSILDSAIDAIITIDDGGIIASANPATERLFGYPLEALVGRDVAMLMPEPDRGAHPGYMRRYLETGIPRIIGIGREAVGQRADGRTFPLHLTVSEARIGSRRHFTGIVRDLSESRSAQEEAQQLGEILEQSLNEIYVFDDRSLRFLLVNRGARENLGFSLEELRQMTPLDLKHEFTPEAFEALIAPLRRGEQQRAVFRTSHRRKDGTTYRVEAHVQHSAGKDHRGRFVSILQDVTEKEALETRLAQSQKLEAIGQLAGGIAHDFNNLLTSIQGSSELLAGRLPEGDRSQRAISRIRQAAERGAALTQKLLAFGRRQAPQPEVIDLNGAIEQVGELANRLIGDDIEVRLDLAADLERVLADRTQIDQIVLNLMVNAGDAMPRGGLLTLATRRLAIDEAAARRMDMEPGPAIQLRVEDTGTGMSAEVMSHIFEPFFTTKEVGKGTGLGLATVYGIVKQNRWGIEVDSEPGRGSAFRIHFPATRAAASPTAGARRRAQRERGGETILLVEDDLLLRDMATEILEGEGYRVHVAPEPAGALRMAGELGPGISLLISDVVMPQMTGTELAGKLREALPELRVLLMSGYADEALEARGARPSDMAFLAKPFTNEALVQRVREVLDA
jgi:PAS domain S-box-containing protein